MQGHSFSSGLFLLGCLSTAFLLRIFGVDSLLSPVLITWLGALLFLDSAVEDHWIRLENMITGLVLFGVLFHLISEFVPTSGVRIVELAAWLGLSLVSLRSHVLSRSASRCVSLRSFFWFVSFLMTLWLTLSAVSTRSKVRLLGLGYDNYGHLSAARFMETQGRSFLLERSELITLIVTDTPQGAATTLASVSHVALGNGDVSSFITLYSFFQLILPIGLGWLWITTAWKTRTRTQASAFIFIAIFSLMFGHFGRIWLSGYFASNFATLYACIALRNVISSDWNRLRIAPIHAVVLFNIWPILAVAYSAVMFLGLFLRFLVAPSASIINLESWLRKSWRFRSSDVVLLVCAPSVYFVLRAMSRTFIPGSYWTDGGIERPAMSAYIVGLAALALIVLLSAPRRNSAVMLGLSACCTALFVLAVSYISRGVLTYYPIKVLIGVCCLVLTAAAFGTAQHSATRSNLYVLERLLILLSLVIFYVSQVQWYREDTLTFRGGYMGRLEHSIQSWVRGEQLVVDADGVASLSRRDFGNSRVILYLSDRYESELNTRWINSLNLRWSDKNWGTWSQIRQQITDERYSEADATIIETETTVIIRESFMGHGLEALIEKLPKSFGQGRLCLLTTSNNVSC